MKGGHDLGGRQGFGPINPEPESEEPVFHSEWERRAFALTMAAGMLGQWNIDQSRHARERQHPTAYLSQSYYLNWLVGTEKLLVENGLLSADELASGVAEAGDHAGLRIPGPDDARKILTSGGPVSRVISEPPRFALGDDVVVQRRRALGHTRAPDYVQGCRGRIRTQYGAHVFPDANCEGDPAARHLYSVEFASRELWGGEGETFDVLVDLWEPYLLPAE